MMELIRLTEKTCYLRNVTQIGLYVPDGRQAWIIDTGVDKIVGKRILKIVKEQGWQVAGIINTHSHADHIGGNAAIQEQTQCPILCSRVESGFIESPQLEGAVLYGGCPDGLLSGKFYRAQPSQTQSGWSQLPPGLSVFPLYGHAGGMVGVRTDDEVYFIGDAVLDEAGLAKHPISYTYDVRAFLETLDWLDRNLQGKTVVPSHAPVTTDIVSLTAASRRNALENLALVESLCAQAPATQEEICKQVFDHYGLECDFGMYQLNASTLRGYVAYLCGCGRLEPVVEGNILRFCKTDLT